ncbi:hypothetical protein AB4Z18_17335 [Leifsonia sp. 2TAF2]|uniref:hypothetical protein n=1 Tax=Leifsonia sp. 2TAF2 TaxID=3233009 RepID=UPI003F9B8E1B
MGAGLTGFAATDAATTNAVDAVAAIQQVAPTAVSDVAKTSSDADTAIQASLPSGDTVAVPKDPTDGVQLSGAGDAPDLRIGLPFAAQATEAIASQKAGVVVYDNNNGSSTVPVAHADGTVQLNTVIENAQAPKRYDYRIDVPNGASLVQTPGGTVAIVTADGSPLRVFGDAWAKDANGEPVPTHYEVHGATLTQVVAFTEHTAFPVVADPSTSAYSYNCVLTNGSSYFLKPGTALTTCKGSRLQMYYNGRVAYTYYLTLNGLPGNPARASLDCIVAIAGTGAGLVTTTSGLGVWATAASIYGLKACIA